MAVKNGRSHRRNWMPRATGTSQQSLETAKVGHHHFRTSPDQLGGRIVAGQYGDGMDARCQGGFNIMLHVANKGSLGRGRARGPRE